MNLIGLIFR